MSRRSANSSGCEQSTRSAAEVARRAGRRAWCTCTEQQPGLTDPAPSPDHRKASAIIERADRLELLLSVPEHYKPDNNCQVHYFQGRAAIDLAGDRAVAQTKMTISQRGNVHGVLEQGGDVGER